MNVEEAFATWHFSIILISLRVKVALITEFYYVLKSCCFEKLFQLKFTTLYTGQERHNSYIVYIQLATACSEVAAFLQTAGAHHISNVFYPMS